MIDCTLAGLIVGLIIGLLMALFTLIFYRRVNKPHLFQFAMVILTTMVALVLIQPQLTGFNTARQFYPFFKKLLLISVAKLVAIALFSSRVARKYIEEISPGNQKGKA